MSNLAEKLKGNEDSFSKDTYVLNVAYLLGRAGKAKKKYRKILDDQATKINLNEKLDFIKKHLGRQLTAYVIQVHPKTLDKYLKQDIFPEKEPTKILIREVFKITKILVDAYDSEVAVAWLRGTNSLLNEESPADILHKSNALENYKLVIIAALAFIEE